MGLYTKYEGWIVGAILFLILSWMIGRVYGNVSTLEESHIVTSGTVTYLGYQTGGSGASAEYEYFVDGRRYIGGFVKKRICDTLTNYERERLIGTTIPIIYSPDEPQISWALLHRNTINKYQVELPDSILSEINRLYHCK